MSADGRLLVPAVDDVLWPSLGGQVCQWIEQALCHGPGDLLGEPVTLTDEQRLFLWRVYEVHPRGHADEGRRRFKQATMSRRKGVGKTELAAWVAIAETHPEAPVRFAGWDAAGDPVGRGVIDAYVPMVAVTLEQTEDLAYGAVHAILTSDGCQIGDDFDIGLERILHRSGRGKLVPLTGSPSARDGARTTFQHFDETHLWTEPRLRKAHKIMLFNIPKRRLADGWSLSTTTAYGPGEGSVAEDAHRLALAIDRGEASEPTFLLDHRQASERHDLTTRKGLREAILEASGDAASFADIPAIEALFASDDINENMKRRFWLNQARRLEASWFPAGMFEQLEQAGHPADGAEIVLAFDGSYSRDSTVLVGATVDPEPHLFLVAGWERPVTASAGWRVPRSEVLATIRQTMERFRVVEFAPDPPGWHREIEDLESEYVGVVVRFDTNRPSLMGPAIDAFDQAVRDGLLSHDGEPMLIRHIRNVVKSDGRGYPRLSKPADDPEARIDAAVGCVVAYTRAVWRHNSRLAAVPNIWFIDY